MSYRQQSKRAAFAKRQASRRKVDRICRDNRHRPGFLGAVSNFKITAADGRVVSFSQHGALFMSACAVNTGD